MRKISSEKDIEKKKKRNLLFISIFMLLVLVFGTIGFGLLSAPSFGSDDSNNNIAEGQLVISGNQWAAIMGGQVFYFSSSPESTENVSVEIFSTLSNYLYNPLYIDSDNPSIAQEIGSTLGRYASRVQEACYGPCSRDLPEKNCSENIIVWRDGSENRVYQEENCVFIDGDLRAVDAFLYDLFDLS